MAAFFAAALLRLAKVRSPDWIAVTLSISVRLKCPLGSMLLTGLLWAKSPVPEKPVHALFGPHEEVVANEGEALSRPLSRTANRMEGHRVKTIEILPTTRQDDHRGVT